MSLQNFSSISHYIDFDELTQQSKNKFFTPVPKINHYCLNKLT